MVGNWEWNLTSLEGGELGKKSYLFGGWGTGKENLPLWMVGNWERNLTPLGGGELGMKPYLFGWWGTGNEILPLWMVGNWEWNLTSLDGGELGMKPYLFGWWGTRKETLPLWMVRICWATTDNTSRSIRLNSSKQDHAPQDAKPYKYTTLSLQAGHSSQTFLYKCVYFAKSWLF